METKHNEIYDNEKVKRWYANVGQGSEITADIWRRNLARFCDILNISPDDILEQARDGSLKESFERFRDIMFEKGNKGAYIEKFKQAIRSFTQFNDINYVIKLKIKNSNKNETTEDERVPTREELSKFLLLASPRGKVSISLMAFSGLRPESLGYFRGEDGLILNDIEDLDLKKLAFKNIPAKINIRSSISKTDNRYFTFLNEEGCKYIIDYLKMRIQDGEILTAESPLLGIDTRGAYQINGQVKERKSGHRFLRTSLITREIRQAIRDAECNFRPYVLRAFFATAMDRAEYNGLISHAWRQFFMGHKGDIEFVYSTNKRLLPEQIEEMRKAYLKSSKFLEPAETVTKEDFDNLERTFTSKFLKILGFSDSEIKEMSKLSDDELQEKIKNRGGFNLNNHRQRVISIFDVEKFLEEGWEYVNSLPNDKAIIKFPEH